MINNDRKLLKILVSFSILENEYVIIELYQNDYSKDLVVFLIF